MKTTQQTGAQIDSEAYREATLLSGAIIAQRPLTLNDQNFLAVASKRRTARAVGDAITQLLNRTTVRVIDPGPYTITDDATLPWKTALSGDRIDALITLRMASYPDGDKAYCEVRCSSCGDRFGWEVDLENDVARKPYPTDTLDKLRSGEPFTVVVAGCTVSFTLTNGDSEERYRRLADDYPNRDLSALLRARITDVNGKDGAVPRTDIMDWLDGGNTGRGRWPGLSAADAELLRNAMDAADGGYDTAIDAVHPACGGVTTIDLPFDSILMPAREIRERRLKRRRGR